MQVPPALLAAHRPAALLPCCRYLLLSWLPTLLRRQGADLSSAGLLVLGPHVVAFAAANAGAALADRALLPRLGLAATRKVMEAAAQLGPCAAFCALAYEPEPGVAATAALSTVAVACGAFVQSGFWANIIDVAPRHAGVLLGLSNTLATLPGVLCNLAAGGLGLRPVFALSALLEATGAVTFLLHASAEPQFR